MELSKDLKSRQEVRDLVERAAKAQKALFRMDQTALDRIVSAMAEAAQVQAAALGKLAQEETGFGNACDKEKKNGFASQTLWNSMKQTKCVGVLRKDSDAGVWEIGVPVGVIAAITPSTNPTATVIYKAMIALKSGNAIVFSPHPGAKICTWKAAQVITEAAEAAGCPKGAIGCISIPTMEAVEELMHHPEVKLILATGGPAMVKAAYSSGKPAIGVGAGNGPAYLHKSCDLQQAVRDIVVSKTFDNGTICASEQSIILDSRIAAAAEAELVRQGCFILQEADAKKLGNVLFRSNGTMNPAVVGKSVAEIARMSGLSEKAQTAKLLLARENGVGKDHPYSMEKLCPVLGLYVVDSEEQALKLSCEILNHEGRGHTFMLHAREEAVVTRFAGEIPVSRFLVNTPGSLGGIGQTTSLFPALTLGCGAVGGSSSSNNIGPMDLINIRRVAWGVKITQPEKVVEVRPDDRLVEMLTQRLLKKLNEKGDTV